MHKTDGRELPPLPLGTASFSALREAGEIYADKTALVRDLAATRGKFLLSRPRRFGKSLLLSTFESLFKHGLRDFKGLAIENQWNDRTYPVLHLDFSAAKRFRSVEGFLERLAFMIEDAAIYSGIQLPRSFANPIDALSSFFSTLPNSSLVLLIDEYDAPLAEHLDNPALFSEIQDVLSDLYLAVKRREGAFRFFFMTGITRFRRLGIFSGFNSLQDISLDPEYGTLLGYTREEIQTAFPGYLRRAENALCLDEDSLLAKMWDHYGGFCFDERSSARVFCPWSVLNFLNRPDRGFKNYWTQSAGKPSVLSKYLTEHALDEPESFGKEHLVKLEDLSSASGLQDIAPLALMAQAGYLSIKEVSASGVAALGYPNQEVAQSFARLYADELLKGRPLDLAGLDVGRVFAEGTVSEAAELLDRVVNAIDYRNFPISDEAACRAYMEVLLFGASLIPMAERHSSQGRSDLEFDAGDRHWVLEFKYARTAGETKAKLEEGLEQIRARRYGVLPHRKELKRAVLVFCGEERRFAAFAEAAADAGPEDLGAQ